MYKELGGLELGLVKACALIHPFISLLKVSRCMLPIN